MHCHQWWPHVQLIKHGSFTVSCIFRFQQDTLLGVASIPLSPLLQESWVQGTAPVLAMMTRPDGQSQDRVQVKLQHAVVFTVGRDVRPVLGFQGHDDTISCLLFLTAA